MRESILSVVAVLISLLLVLFGCISGGGPSSNKIDCNNIFNTTSPLLGGLLLPTEFRLTSDVLVNGWVVDSEGTLAFSAWPCDLGSNPGENVNYYYCGNSIRVIRTIQQQDSSGTILSKVTQRAQVSNIVFRKTGSTRQVGFNSYAPNIELINASCVETR